MSQSNDPTEQRLLVAVVIFIGCALSVAMINGVYYGLPVPVVITCLLASPVVMFLARWFERSRAASDEDATCLSYRWLHQPREQSWAYLYGDIVCLPFALAVAAHTWPSLPKDRWYQLPVWWVCTLACAALYAIVFYLVDRPNYHRQDAIGALASPTRWAHGAIAVPAFASGLIFGGVPLLVEHRWDELSWFMMGLGGWMALGIIDVKRGAMCRQRHPNWNSLTCRPVPW